MHTVQQLTVVNGAKDLGFESLRCGLNLRHARMQLSQLDEQVTHGRYTQPWHILYLNMGVYLSLLRFAINECTPTFLAR